MKDYSKVKYVKPSVDGSGLTMGKVYDFEFDEKEKGWIKNDYNYNAYINIPKSSHLQCKGCFIPCDKDGNEIEI